MALSWLFLFVAPFLVRAEKYTLPTVLPKTESAIVCESPVNLLLSSVVSQPKWVEQWSWQSMQQRFATPTRQFGEWIDIYIMADATRVSITSELTHKLYEFKKDSCTKNVVLENKYTEIHDETRFTDSDLKALFLESRAKKSPGIMYVWSPREEFSLKGLREAQSLTRGFKLRLVALMDPAVDMKEAEAILKRAKIVNVDLMRLEARELLRRGARNNYPTMLMFKNGAFVGPVVPGYLTPVEFNRVTRKYL